MAALFVAGCSVTWRQPEIRPLNPVRTYAVALEDACEAVPAAYGTLEIEVAERREAQGSCLFESAPRTLTGGDERLERLRDIAYVSAADSFTRGRYTVTAALRRGAGGDVRIRLTARIEGYEGAYRVLRSNGTLEDELFARISAILGVDPADGAVVRS